MTTQSLLESCFVLHTRLYRETSLLVDFWGKESGIVRCVAKGVRGKRSTQRVWLQPFQRVRASWQGKRELKVLTSIEPEQDSNISLIGAHLFAGFYLNELIVRLLPTSEPHLELFEAYWHTLVLLSQATQKQSIEPSLREFESILLQELGYALTWSEDDQRLPINPDYQYMLAQPEFVWHRVYNSQQTGSSSFTTPLSHELLLPGSLLLKIAIHEWDCPEVLNALKRVHRFVFHILMGGQPLRTRELFRLHS
ncbi:MAG: DNA repair protein RecO [Pseudomonadota bacterium]